MTEREGLFPDGHDGVDVTNARIREAHSLMAADWLKGDEEVHYAYKQGHDERCYICALLARNERLRVALQDVQGIALNGLEVGDTEADRLFEIDRRITEELDV